MKQAVEGKVQYHQWVVVPAIAVTQLGWCHRYQSLRETYCCLTSVCIALGNLLYARWPLPSPLQIVRFDGIVQWQIGANLHVESRCFNSHLPCIVQLLDPRDRPWSYSKRSHQTSCWQDRARVTCSAKTILQSLGFVPRLIGKFVRSCTNLNKVFFGLYSARLIQKDASNWAMTCMAYNLQESPFSHRGSVDASFRRWNGRLRKTKMACRMMHILVLWLLSP